MKSGCAVLVSLLVVNASAIAQLADAGRFFPVEPVVTVGHGELQVKVGKTGEMQIDTGADSYIAESCWSYPGSDQQIGWNGFPRSFNNHDNYPDVTRQRGNEPSWAPVARKAAADTAIIEAQGACYRLVRTVKVLDGRVDVVDQFTNQREQPTGIVPRHRVTANEDFLERYTPYGLEVAQNPALYLAGPRGRLGLVMQDDVSRSRYRFQIPEKGNRAGFQILRVALDKIATRTFSWSVYVMKEAQGYFDFINRVRNDWNANFTIDGPLAFGYLRPEGSDIKFYLLYGHKEFHVNQVLKNPAELSGYLAWRRIRMLAISPWLDHEPGAMNHVPTWEQWRQIMHTALPALRKAAPEMRVLASIETDWVAIRPDQMKDGHKIPLPDQTRTSGPSVIQTLAPEVGRIIEAAMPEWKDSIVRTAKGEFRVYHYYRGGGPINQLPLEVFPEVGNKRYLHMMEQVKLAIDEVGMDGVYFDEFPLHQVGSTRTYGEWDRMSAEISFGSGEIYGQYKDCSLAGVQARLNVMNHVLSKGKTFVANRQSTTREEQSMAAFRFTETGAAAAKSAAGCEPGVKPPAENYLFFTILNTPIGFGLASGPSSEDPARWIMRGLIAYLRHGMLFYYGDSGPVEPPMTEAGQGALRCIQAMYPITPVELGEGFIVGKEKILSTVCLERCWSKSGEPTVLRFDISGRQINSAGCCEVITVNGQRRIKLNLKDWAEIAVVE